MRVYHFVNEQHGLENIRRRRVKIATINDLNDPFELLGPRSSNAEIRRRFENVKQKLAQRAGLLCFSTKWSNPVQWSHYADGHRGLCLGFDMPDAYLHRVSYSSKRLEPDISALEEAGDAGASEMRRILTTKYTHWRYEREVRCFVTLDESDRESGLYFFEFSPKLTLKKVIVGHRSPVRHNQLVDAFGSDLRGIITRKARLAFQSFSVVEQRNRKLWV